MFETATPGHATAGRHRDARPIGSRDARALLVALALIRSMAPALVFALIPQMPFASLIFDGFQEQVFGLGAVDTLRLPPTVSAELDLLMAHMLETHPHLANCQPTDGDESLPPLFFQQTGSRPGVGTYR